MLKYYEIAEKYMSIFKFFTMQLSKFNEHEFLQHNVRIHTYIHTYIQTPLTIMWGLLRLTPIKRVYKLVQITIY